jgi:hypothetical protein
VFCHYEYKRSKQKPTLEKLSPEAQRLMVALSQKLSVPTMSVLELSVRWFARQEQVE